MSGAPALPMSAERLIPHRQPMRLVETLAEFGERGGTVETAVAGNSLLLDAGGRLEPIGLAELLAQTYAVIKGYGDLLAGRAVKEGFLVGIKKVEFLRPVSAGDRLRISVRAVGSIGGFTLAEGEVLRGGEIVASGSIKLWVPEEELPKGESP